MKEQNRVPRVLLALLSVLLAACGGEGSQAFNLGGPERALPAMRLEPLRLESLERWDLLPGNTPLLKNEDTACQDNSCWLLHNDGTRMVRLLGQFTGERRGIGVIERRDSDGQWHDFLERRICSCGTGMDDWSETADLPAGGTRLLGETSCSRQPHPLPTGNYRFLLPLVIEVDGVSRPGFIARRFVVHPAPSVEREHLRALLAEPRIVACDAQTALAGILVHGMDEPSMRALLASEEVPSALHETLLDELTRLPAFEGLLAEPLTRRGSPLGLRFAMRLSPENDWGGNGQMQDAALSQLLAAFFSGPPDDKLVDALAAWSARWPDTVLPRLVDLLGQDLDDSLRASVKHAIGLGIVESTQHRAQASALLAQRCQAPQRCAGDAAGQSVAQLLQEAVQQESADEDDDHNQGTFAIMTRRTEMASGAGDELASLPGGACADLTRALREYGRYVAGVPLGVELGETETQLCDLAPTQGDSMARGWPTGCHRVVQDWGDNLRFQELMRAIDSGDPGRLDALYGAQYERSPQG